MAVIGVDVGGTKIAAGLVAPGLRVVRRRRVPTPRDGEALLAAVAGVVRDLASGAAEPVHAVGVGLPSLVERGTGRVLMTNHADLAGVDAGTELARRTGLPVAVDNDGNVAALAEHRAGAARGARVAVLLTLGTGVGGGVVVDGRVFSGGRGTGAEFGHVPVQADGPPCPGNCPGRGCLEVFVSGTAVAREGRALAAAEPHGALAGAAGAAQAVTSELVARLAREGEPGCQAILARAGWYLGAGLAGLANVFAPDVIVIGGGLGRVGALLLDPARAEYRARALPPNAAAPVRQARFGAEAGLVGAAALAGSAHGWE